MSNAELTSLLPSFLYGGAPAVLPDWASAQETAETNAEGRRSVRTFTSPDGLLALRITMQEYDDFPAVKYWPELIGCGRTHSAVVSDFRSFDLSLSGLPWAETELRAVTGSKCQPCDFTARKFSLTNIAQQDKLDFTSDEGRPSANWMPYFGLDITDSDGWEFAIGWSGAWNMKVSMGRDEIRCSFGMKNFASRLEPGETLRQPSVLVLRRTGMSAARFQTVIHDFMIAHNAPRNGRGELMKPILPVTVSGGNRRPEDAVKVIDYVVREHMPFDTVWVDAGWYGPEHTPDTTTNCGDCWWKYVGDWRVNTGIHPSGTLLPISDAAHAGGMRFLLWFEPERLVKSAPILKEHPEYARKSKDAVEERCLLNLGHEPAYRWIFSTLCRIIDENKVDIYRQDFNMNPYPVWTEFDEPDRIGVNEIRHITALYRLWDDLRAKYPDMLIDNCAGGGHRLDFELMSRSHTYCRSDYYICRGNREQRKYQHLMGQNAALNLLPWIPFQAGEANCAATFSDYEFFSIIGTGAVFTAPDWEGGCITREFTPEETAWFKKVFRVTDRIRKILTGKFYPLTAPAGLSETIWTAYEGFNPDSGEGFAAFFRRRNAAPAMTFELQSIDPDAKYEVEDASTGNTGILSGRCLARFTAAFDKAPDGKIIFFRKIG